MADGRVSLWKLERHGCWRDACCLWKTVRVRVSPVYVQFALTFGYHLRGLWLSDTKFREEVNTNNLRYIESAVVSVGASVSTREPGTVNMALVNARSLLNKTFILNDFFIQHDLDFLFISETWLNVGETHALIELSPYDCTFFSTPRTTGRGGGLACVFKKGFKCRLLSKANYQSFEAQVMMYDGWKSVLCVLVYRPPKYNKDFIQHFQNFYHILCQVVIIF